MPRKPRTETRKYNVVKRDRDVDPDEARDAYLAICGCRHMTPASVAAMDERLGVGTMELDSTKPIPVLPPPDVDAADSDWMAIAEAPDSALRRIEAEEPVL